MSESPITYDLDAVVSSAIIELGLEEDTPRFRLIFKEFAADALKKLGVDSPRIVESCIDVEDYQFDKPCNLLYLIDLNLIDDNGAIVKFDYSKNGFMSSEKNTSIANGSGGSIKSRHSHGAKYVPVVYDQGTHYSISSTTHEVDYNITSANIKYYSALMDDNGELVFPEDYKDAVVQFIRFKYYQREKNRRTIALSTIQYEEDRWIRELRRIKANNKMPNPVEAEAILRKWLTLIPNFKDKPRNSIGRGSLRY